MHAESDLEEGKGVEGQESRVKSQESKVKSQTKKRMVPLPKQEEKSDTWIWMVNDYWSPVSSRVQEASTSENSGS